MVDCMMKLSEKVKYLDELIKKTQKRLKNSQPCEGQHVVVLKRKRTYQYYLVGPEGKRKYVKKAETEMVRKIMQREYDEAVLRVMREDKRRLETFLRMYDPDSIPDAYGKMSSGRRALVKPVVETDEEYVERWKRQFVGQVNMYEKERKFLTENGEEVRSKSEKILADLFYKMGIPYYYEPRVELRNGAVVYPDFALLDVRRRRTVFWEHFGLANEPEYAVKSMQKLRMYGESGYAIGENLVFSIETTDRPLDVSELKKMAKMWVLE